MYIKGLKYACSTCIKGHRSSSCNHIDRPLFEIRKKGRPVSQCNYCRDLRKTKQRHTKCACSSKKGDNQQPVFVKNNDSPVCLAHSNDEISQGSTCNCDTTLALSTGENLNGSSNVENTLETPYSWALVTEPPIASSSTTTPMGEKSNDQLGFVFRKPSNASRLLDGQPRMPRRRSNKKTKVETTGLSTPPSVSTLFDYKQLDTLSNQETQWEVNPEELTAILNMLQRDVPPLSPLLQPTPASTPHLCGSFHPNCCQPVSEGESVVITITPLVHPSSHPTTTRIVTCYCGSQCTCPGCLVHPSHLLDPYSGPLLNSSASSSYASDDEDKTSTYSNHINFPF